MKKEGYYWELRVEPGRKYDSSQPRVPAGDPRGGQWTSTNVMKTKFGSVHIASPNSTIPDDVRGSDSLLFVDNDGTVYAWKKQGRGFRSHADLARELGWNAEKFDNVARPAFSDMSGFVIATPNVGWRGGRIPSDIHKADAEALKKINRMARRLISVGYDPSVDLIWLPMSGKSIKLPLGDWQ